MKRPVGRLCRRRSLAKLAAAHTSEVEAADSAFEAGAAEFTKAVTGAPALAGVEAGLKRAEPRIKAALSKVLAAYSGAAGGLKCS